MLQPTLFFGKGAGDLPDDGALLKPFAVTGIIGYAIPTDARHTRREVDDETGERSARSRSMPSPGLRPLARVQPAVPSGERLDLGCPRPTRLIPLVELAFETPVQHAQGAGTTAFVNPGILWAGQAFQIGAEAVIPITGIPGPASADRPVALLPRRPVPDDARPADLLRRCEMRTILSVLLSLLTMHSIPPPAPGPTRSSSRRRRGSAAPST